MTCIQCYIYDTKSLKSCRTGALLWTKAKIARIFQIMPALQDMFLELNNTAVCYLLYIKVLYSNLLSRMDLSYQLTSFIQSTFDLSCILFLEGISDDKIQST